MAKSRDFFEDEPLSRNNEPRLSRTLERGPDPNMLGDPLVGKKHGKSRSKKGPWYKHPEVIKGVAAGVVVLVLLLVVLVWQFDLFGGSSQPPRTAAVQPPATAPQADETPPVTPAPPQPSVVAPDGAQPAVPPAPIEPGQPGQLSPPSPEGPAVEQPTEPEKPPLPENFADWKPEHYFRARRENHPKLPEAVAYLGRTFVGSTPTAEGLTNLLKPLPPEPEAKPPDPAEPAAPGVVQPPGLELAPPHMPEVPGIPAPMPHNGMQPYGSGNMAGLVEAIITALGNNGTETARNTIEQVLAGTFQTDDDKVAVEAALKALLDHPCKENDALMLRALTKPDALRPIERQGPWPPKDLQAKAFELTKQSASCGLRTALAAALVELNVRLDASDQMHEFLLSLSPLNCEAQLLLYQKTQLSPEIKTKLEEQFLDYSALAMARLLDIPDQPDQNYPGGMGEPRLAPDQAHGGLIGGFELPGGRLDAPGLNLGSPEGKDAKNSDKSSSERELARRIALGLWSKQFLALLEPRLTPSALDSLEKQPKLILLASTIPHDSTRFALNRLFRKHWAQGPKSLETAGLDTKVATDPGLLTVVKMLPRRDHTATRAAAARATRPVTGGGKLIEDARKKQETEQEWCDFSYKMVVAWCKRFHAAAQARQKAAEAANTGSETPLKLPDGFAISPNARVVASYHLVWPDAAPAGIAELDPGLLDVYYVRVEEMNTPRKATAFYSRQADLRSSDARTKDKITWLDNVRIGSEKGRRRSLDVLITPPESYVPPEKIKDETDTDLVVEILVVEIKDPNR
ncbi:MAG: hypothetical protein GX594_13445 [Pirellulaceae bacterium]|nr:hypothetical protein [Pirellulaceae bacterium]